MQLTDYWIHVAIPSRPTEAGPAVQGKQAIITKGALLR
jgi:hypothetical protein